MAIRQRPQCSAPSAAGDVQQHCSIRLGRCTYFGARYYYAHLRRGATAGDAPPVDATIQHHDWSVLGTTAFFVLQGTASRSDEGRDPTFLDNQRSGVQLLALLIRLRSLTIGNFDRSRLQSNSKAAQEANRKSWCQHTHVYPQLIACISWLCLREQSSYLKG